MATVSAMGSFCTNITLIGADPAAAEAHLLAVGRAAYLGTWGNHTVVYDEVGEAQDGSHAALAAELSDVLGCVSLASLNHDDDIVYLQVFRWGQSLGEFNSAPDYFDDEDGAGGATRGWSDGVGSFALGDLVDVDERATAEPDAPDAVVDPGTVTAGPSRWALGLDAAALVRVVGHGDPARLAAVAAADEVFARDLHHAMVTELGLPAAACGFGFTYLSNGELPDDADDGGLHLVTTPA